MLLVLQKNLSCQLWACSGDSLCDFDGEHICQWGSLGFREKATMAMLNNTLPTPCLYLQHIMVILSATAMKWVLENKNNKTTNPSSISRHCAMLPSGIFIYLLEVWIFQLAVAYLLQDLSCNSSPGLPDWCDSKNIHWPEPPNNDEEDVTCQWHNFLQTPT